MITDEAGSDRGEHGARVPPWRLALRAGLAVLALIGAYVGWRALYFTTDDAYIAFRYVSNAVAGHGLVWNPPPFAPVEGYTSFLWVALLQLTWQLTGLEPPQVANQLSLFFGCLTLLISARLLLRLALPRRLEGHRELLCAFVLLGMLSNRTFLAWLSSGLETALYSCCFLWWIGVAITPPRAQGRSWALRLAASAAACALARPDGLLAVLATLMIALRDVRLLSRAGEGTGGLGARAAARRLLLYSPLLVVFGHLLWRRWYYGAWLPNTYYAKVVSAWPESGLRYAACFVLEYGVWVWGLLLGAWIVPGVRGLWSRRAALVGERFTALVALAVVLAHFGYYTLVVGGDHFEYRVYNHLVPLLLISAVWLAARVFSRAIAVHLALVALLVASLPIPWTHWLATRELQTRRETFQLALPIAGRLPWPLRPVVAQWDRWQAWLIARHVGLRHQEHKVFERFMTATSPSRAEGAKLGWETDHPVGVGISVGRPGWVLPGVALIDVMGLNDRVIARHPVSRRPGERRYMAHERTPPAGYIECFRPNVEVRIGRRWVYRRRKRPLTDAEIRACERRRWY